METKLNRELHPQITKDTLHDIFLERWIENNYWGAGYLATGTGKSRIGVLATQFSTILSEHESPRVLLVVPTERLRDENWKEEYEKWGGMKEWDNNLVRTCYASLSKIEEEQEWDLVILDEGHRITEHNYQFFEKNKVKRLLLLTATPPPEPEKKQLLRQLRVEPLLEYTVEEAEQDGLVSPFQIYVIKSYLDDVNKNIKAGNEKRRWYQTEKEKYTYLCNQIEKILEEKKEKLGVFQNLNTQVLYELRTGRIPSYYITEEEEKEYQKYLKIEKSYDKKWEMLIMQRMQFIYNLQSKTNLARRVVKKLKTETNRILLFGGSKLQVEEICGKDKVFHSSSNTQKQLKEENTAFHRFKSGILDLLGVIKSVNEGHTIPNLDIGIVVQINSKELDIIQRIGRIIRYRKDFTGKIFIIVCWDSVDRTWFEKATSGFQEKQIKWFDESFFNV